MYEGNVYVKKQTVIKKVTCKQSGEMWGQEGRGNVSAGSHVISTPWGPAGRGSEADRPNTDCLQHRLQSDGDTSGAGGAP